MSAAFHCSVG